MQSTISVQGAAFNTTAPAPGLMTSPRKLRAALLVFGVLLGLGGVWVLAPEILSPKEIRLAADREAALALAPGYPRALLAARAAQIRGELWASAAFTDSSLLWLDPSAPLNRAAQEKIERARSNAEAGLALAPINGEAWLFLASLPPTSAGAKSGGGDARLVTLLEMSYFTAPSDVDIAPRRLERAVGSGALSDPDLREFVKGDIRALLANTPPLTRPIVAAYRNASPQNQPVLESLIMDVDPALGQSLRSAAPK